MPIWLTLLTVVAVGFNPLEGAESLEPVSTGRWWLFLAEETLLPSELERRLDEVAASLTPRSLERRAKSIARTPPVRRCDLLPNPEILQTIEATGCRVIVVARYLNAVSVSGSKESIAHAQKLDFVKHSSVVRGWHKEKEEEHIDLSPEDELSPEDYGRTWRQVNMLNIPAAHNAGFRGEGILIGVQDAGFDNLSHRCFQRLQVVATWDFLNGDPNVGDEDDLGFGRHGTRTLSVLAGWDPGEFIGVAPNARYVLTKTENSETETRIEEDTWVAGLWFCDSLGVDVVSSSLSYRNWYDYPDMDGRTAVTTRAADSAASAGMVVVNSVGNTGNYPYPINKIGAPADGRFVVSVGGLNRDSTYWSSSSLGPTYDGRIKPDVSAQASSVAVAASFDQSGYTSGSGTSFACPAVAGVVALILQSNRNLNPLQVSDILRRTALQAVHPDTLVGWGAPDAMSSIRAAQQGVGQIKPILPDGFNLSVYPNPFNGYSTVSFSLPNATSDIRLIVYDRMGREVGLLANGRTAEGLQKVVWRPTGVSSGLYWVCLEVVNGRKETKSIVLMR